MRELVTRRCGGSSRHPCPSGSSAVQSASSRGPRSSWDTPDKRHEPLKQTVRQFVGSAPQSRARCCLRFRPSQSDPMAPDGVCGWPLSHCAASISVRTARWPQRGLAILRARIPSPSPRKPKLSGGRNGGAGLDQATASCAVRGKRRGLRRPMKCHENRGRLRRLRHHQRGVRGSLTRRPPAKFARSTWTAAVWNLASRARNTLMLGCFSLCNLARPNMT